MTSDRKTRSSGSAYRRPLDPEERYQRRVTLAFIALTVAIVVVVVLGVVYGYYDQHFQSVASVNGAGISKDQYSDRVRLEAFRLDREDRRITQALAAGTLTAAQASTMRTDVSNRQSSVSTDALDALIDLTFKDQLAADQGISVTDADVDAAVAADEQVPETRRISIIEVAPARDSSGTVTAEARQAALKAADGAVADLAAGTDFATVAKQYSTHASKSDGGAYGWIGSSDTTFDPALVHAVFSTDKGSLTPLITASDGSYQIARVDDVTPPAMDPTFEQDLRAAMSWDAYRSNVRMETIASRLQDSVVAKATTGDQTQLHLAEIFLSGDTTAKSSDSGKVRASHILYSPEDDPAAARSGSTGQGGIPTTDPSWIVAQAEAGLATQRLQGITDVAAREAAFAAMAKAHSDDTGSGPDGGDLGWFARNSMVPEFGDALFDHLDTLKKGDIVGPVKTDFGYHVIMFEGYEAPLDTRLATLKTDLAKPDADFAAIARSSSDGAQAPNGGDIGWRAQAQLPPDAADALLALQVGGVTDPIDVSNGDAASDGWHVYKLLDKAQKPLDPAQVAEVATTAFEDWYTPQRDAAESAGKITRSDSGG